jgi:hypothetical protein
MALRLKIGCFDIIIEINYYLDDRREKIIFVAILIVFIADRELLFISKYFKVLYYDLFFIIKEIFCKNVRSLFLGYFFLFNFNIPHLAFMNLLIYFNLTYLIYFIHF